MKSLSILLLGVIIGAVAVASTRLLGFTLERHFWLGLSNGFLVGAGFVVTTSLLTSIIRVTDLGVQALRKSR